jgi:dTDP-4-dehydrorhamnose reductase
MIGRSRTDDFHLLDSRLRGNDSSIGHSLEGGNPKMNKQMRILIGGASGLVGSEVARAANGHQVLGIARTASASATVAVDLTDRTQVAKVVSEFKPELVVVASAWPWVDGCEKDPARSKKENVSTVENLIAEISPTCKLIFFSTEHVFDGTLPLYREDSQTNPLNVYAKHKNEVEQLLVKRPNSLIARTSYVFGEEVRRKNFLYRVVDASKTKTPLKVPVAQGGLPTWSVWLAKSALELSINGIEGIVHLTGQEVLTKALWAKRIALGLKLEHVEIQEVSWQDSGQIAPRPAEIQLVSTKHTLLHPPLDEVLSTLKVE